MHRSRQAKALLAQVSEQLGIRQTSITPKRRKADLQQL